MLLQIFICWEKFVNSGSNNRQNFRLNKSLKPLTPNTCLVLKLDNITTHCLIFLRRSHDKCTVSPSRNSYYRHAYRSPSINTIGLVECVVVLLYKFYEVPNMSSRYKTFSNGAPLYCEYDGTEWVRNKTRIISYLVEFAPNIHVVN